MLFSKFEWKELDMQQVPYRKIDKTKAISKILLLIPAALKILVNDAHVKEYVFNTNLSRVISNTRNTSGNSCEPQ